MKRYLTGYSRDIITIRDRKTGLEKRVAHVGKENAELIQEAIKSTNYYINTPKNGKVELKTLNDIEVKQTKTKRYWGEFAPVNMRWESEILREKEERKIVELNRILGLQ